MANIALIRGSRVENVVVLDPESEQGNAYLAVVAPDSTVDTAATPLAVGQYVDANGRPISLPSLTADKASIPPDGTTAAVVTYTNAEPDAPASVDFDVNGAVQTVTLANDSASISVVSSTAGDTVTVTAAGLSTTIEVTS